jgi:phage/plasmid-like protein (TIGR03299 family)
VAHQIENENGTDMFIGAQDAWHRLGEVVGDDFDFHHVRLTRPDIASPVSKQPLYVQRRDGMYEIDHRVAVVRHSDEKVVGVVGSDYGIVTPEEAYEWASAISEFGDIPLVSAGNLRGGSQFFFTLRMGVEAPAGIEYTPYVSVVSSHDGSQPLQAIFSPTIVVCANTLAAAQSNARSKVTLRHTARIQDRMEVALDTLRVSAESAMATNKLIADLAAIKVPSFKKMLDQLLPELTEEGSKATRRSNTRSDILSLARSTMCPEDLWDTGWAVVQAVNTYENWVKPVRKNKSNDNAIAVRQFDAALTGKGQDLTQQAISAVFASV